MPKLDVRGQQQAAPAVQQVQGAYGEGIGAAMLQVGEGIKSGAKAAMAAVDFFDMAGESKASAAAAQLNLDAEQKVFDLEHDPDIDAADREQELNDWIKGEIASRGKGFRGRGARLWTAQSQQAQGKYNLAARQSGRRTALNEMRAGVMTVADALAAQARLSGNVTPEQVTNFTTQLESLVEQGAMESTEATRLRISTMNIVRAYTAENRELGAAHRIVDSVIDLAQEDPDLTWSEVQKELRRNEDFSDPQIRDAAEADAKTAFENVRAEGKRFEAEQYQDARLAFLNGEENVLATLPTLTPENQVKFTEWSKGFKGFATVESDPGTFNGLMKMLVSSDPTVRQQFYDTDLVGIAHLLEKSDFDRFQKHQTDHAKNSPGGPEFLGGALATFEAKASTRFKGWTDAKMEKARAQFTLLALKESQKLNRELTTDEVSSLMDRALTPVQVQGLFFDDAKKPALLMDEEDRQALMDDPDEYALSVARAVVEDLYPDLDKNSKEYNTALSIAVQLHYSGLPGREGR